VGRANVRRASMEKRFFQMSLLLVILGLMLISPLMEVFGAAYPFTSNYERTFTFDVQYGYYQFSHKLYVSMPPSLYEYYHTRSHVIRTDSNYAKFVTPDVFKSVAENIQNVTGDLPYSEEQFANAVLTLIRHIPFVESDVKYPVETLLDNSGDCDVLSLLAASIMKAGGLDVVLLYYKGINPSHINIGVYLPYTPVYRTWWLTPAGFEYNNKTYWMAECTPLGEWKVGDQPSLLAGIEPQIISLENCEELSPAHVASSLDGSFEPSSISITVSSENASAEEGERAFTISGSISPAYSGKDVVMYVGQDESSYNAFRTTSTDENGNYSFVFNFNSTGAYYIMTSVSGYANYSSADSEKLAVFAGFYQPSVSTADEASASIIPIYALSIIQRSRDILQSNLTGTGVSLSGEFIILRKGQEATTVETEQTITVPAYTHYIRLPRSRRYAAIHIPEQVITLPSEQPAKKWFGFILQNNGESNYTARVKMLSDNDATLLTNQLGGNNTTFMNASISTSENTWYKITTETSENEKTAELFDANGTLLQTVTGASDVLSADESGILVAYSPDAVVAFRNLKVETLGQSEPTGDDYESSAEEFEMLLPYVELTLLLAVAVAAVAYVKERKRVTVTKPTGS